MSQNPTPPRMPEYVVLHNNVGGQFTQGEVIPHGTYSEEQLARLVGLGAIEPVDPATVARVEPADAPAVVSVPMSSEEFKEQEEARALEAAGGPAPAATGVLDPDAPAEVQMGTIDDPDAARRAAATGAVVPIPPNDPRAEVMPGVTAAQRDALVAAGFVTAADIRNATDEQLEAVEGIGPGTVKRLREATRE